MHDTSARLVERVLPAASYRQWVLTVPFPLRLRIARDPDPGELSRVLNLFHRALRAELRRRTRRLGLPWRVGLLPANASFRHFVRPSGRGHPIRNQSPGRRPASTAPAGPCRARSTSAPLALETRPPPVTQPTAAFPAMRQEGLTIASTAHVGSERDGAAGQQRLFFRRRSQFPPEPKPCAPYGPVMCFIIALLSLN